MCSTKDGYKMSLLECARSMSLQSGKSFRCESKEKIWYEIQIDRSKMLVRGYQMPQKKQIKGCGNYWKRLMRKHHNQNWMRRERRKIGYSRILLMSTFCNISWSQPEETTCWTWILDEMSIKRVRVDPAKNVQCHRELVPERGDNH